MVYFSIIVGIINFNKLIKLFVLYASHNAVQLDLITLNNY